jgi:hypothetical protein
VSQLTAEVDTDDCLAPPHHGRDLRRSRC